jgi:hypothetical protein
MHSFMSNSDFKLICFLPVQLDELKNCIEKLKVENWRISNIKSVENWIWVDEKWEKNTYNDELKNRNVCKIRLFSTLDNNRYDMDVIEKKRTVCFNFPNKLIRDTYWRGSKSLLVGENSIWRWQKSGVKKKKKSFMGERFSIDTKCFTIIPDVLFASHLI